MEEHRSPAHAKPEAEQPPQQQVPAAMAVAVAVDVAAPAALQNSTAAPAENGDVAAAGAAENGTAASAANGDGGGSELLGGPRWTGLHLFVMNIRSVFKLDELGAEVLGIAVPASLALTADPLASLIDTAFIGRLGSVEIAAVGVAIAVFNQVMKVCISRSSASPRRSSRRRTPCSAKAAPRSSTTEKKKKKWNKARSTLPLPARTRKSSNQLMKKPPRTAARDAPQLPSPSPSSAGRAARN
jgi:hypothetical protein